MGHPGVATVAIGAALALGLGGCAGSKHDLGSPAAAWAPAPGATYADSSEQVRVVQAIRAMDNLRVDRCGERRVTDTAVVDSVGAVQRRASQGTATASAHLPWHERWTIDRCGKQISYLVEFSPEDSGRVAIIVRFE